MTDRETHDRLEEKVEEASGVEKLLSTDPVEVFHEHGVHTQAVKGVGERIEEGREKAVSTLETVEDEVERLMGDLLGTDTHAGVYVAVRKTEASTPNEVADEAGLTPARVEEILEELEGDGFVESSDDGYVAVTPTKIVKETPERVGDWISSSIRGEGRGAEEDIMRLPVRGKKPELEADYREDEGEITVRVKDPGDADYVSILVGTEVKHRFEPPSSGDEVTLRTEPEDAVVARSGRIEKVN